MPLIANGVYAECDDKSYEIETTYYLNFQIESALFSINKMVSKTDDPFWKNKCQYYHYFSDHLLYSIGQITDRFVVTDKDRGLKLERKEMNCKNYQFLEGDYPLLSDKRARNMIEHIDEYNQKIISVKKGVGGFNLIDDTVDSNLIEILRKRRDVHPYTLDLLEKKLLIRRKNENIDIKLDELRDELIKLRKTVQSFASYLQ